MVTDRDFLLPTALIHRFLKRFKLNLEAILEGRKVWKTKDGMVALTPRQLERLVAESDPVAWYFLNLQEREDFGVDPNTREPIYRAGDPWILTPDQEVLARAEGDILVQSAAGVGKSRDIYGGTLWEADLWPNQSSVIVADSKQTLWRICQEIVWQIEKNPNIAGGMKSKRGIFNGPVFELEFRNGHQVFGRITGISGRQLRQIHVGRCIRADEVALYPRRGVDEIIRIANQGCSLRFYSTPNDDLKSRYFQLSQDALPYDAAPATRRTKTGEIPQFRRLIIRKDTQPFPLWSEQERDRAIERYGGSHTPGWLQNIEGAWASAGDGVFSAEQLEEAFEFIQTWAMVACVVDQRAGTATLSSEHLIDRDATEPFDRPRKVSAESKLLAEAIAFRFPPFSAPPDQTDPRPLFFAGLDPGSLKSLCEFQFDRLEGRKRVAAFRLSLRGAKWATIADIVRALDCRGAHRVVWGIDIGGSGWQFFESLRDADQTCEDCGRVPPTPLNERILDFHFGKTITATDEEGAPILSTSRTDQAGDPVETRLQTKDLATSLLESRFNKRSIVCARDTGAGNPRIAGPALWLQVRVKPTTGTGPRQFVGIDDDFIDAQRLVELAIRRHAETNFSGLPPLTWGKTVGSVGSRPGVAVAQELGDFAGSAGSVTRDMGSFAHGSLRMAGLFETPVSSRRADGRAPSLVPHVVERVAYTTSSIADGTAGTITRRCQCGEATCPQKDAK